MRRVTTMAAVIALTLAVLNGQAQQAAGRLSIDALVDIRHPSRATWSPDARSVAFVWDQGGVQNVFAVPSDGSAAPAALTRYEGGSIDGLFWSADGSTLLFAREGALWQVARTGGEVRPVWTATEGMGAVALSPDGTRAAYERQGDLWVRGLAGGVPMRLTETPALESGPVWSPDGTRVAFAVGTATRREEAPDYIGAKILFTWYERGAADVGVVPAGGGKTVIAGASPAPESAPSWIDAARICLQRMSDDLTTREILVGDATSGEARAVHRDVDDKWFSLAGSSRPAIAPSPNGRWIAFISDRDGWDHLYVVSTSGGPIAQVTRGRYEVRNLAWSPDGARIAFDTNEGDNPGSRHVAVATIGENPAAAAISVLTSGRGTNVESTWAPDGTRLVCQHTDPRNSADLFVLRAQAGGGTGKPVRLTDSLPAGVDRAALVEPQFVRYPAADGAQVPASLFVPSGLDKSRKHPAIVWIHGDGTNQNYDGWHVQRNYAVYYSLHQYLAQRGYVVLGVDYRGSIGYGKQWRQGHFRDLGGKDYQDVAAGAAYLGTLGYVDTSRIGVWGLSYGGFMTLQALTVTPELFRCGIDVAGVVDWRDWAKDPDGPWIKGRMGSTVENAEIYRRTAPIERIDRIVRPVMVLAGTADVNVPFLESVRAIDELLKQRKNVEFMMYPGEFHYFQRAHVLRDAWLRVERFFDMHLRAARND